MDFDDGADDDDAFAAIDVDSVVRGARAARDASNETRATSRGSAGGKDAEGGRRREGWDAKENAGRDEDATLAARRDAMRAGANAREEGTGDQLTVTSMFACGGGGRVSATTVLGEVRERLARGPETTTTSAARGGREKTAREHPPAKRTHQGTLPKELMIRKCPNKARELEALMTNLAPDALGERDAAGLTRCDAAGGPEGLPMDPEAIQTYVYPAQISRREYQFAIARDALLTNSLVCLPTGLGKTLIAAVVMYNYYRWFPTGKIIFMAPTRPLVDQQMSACHTVVGIPASDTIVLMGSTKKDDSGSRRDFWREKRLFFCTPHVMANDLQSGDLDANQIVCVVVDEAHHARGQYASAEVLRLLHERKVRFRLLALTATPGQGLEEVQNVVKTLRIGRIDFRSDQDPDVSRYTHKREMTVEKVKPGQAMSHVQDMLCELLRPCCAKLLSMGALGEASYRMSAFIKNKATNGASRIEPPAWFTLQNAQREVFRNERHVHAKGQAHSLFETAMELSKAYELLLKYGAKNAYEYIDKRGRDKSNSLVHRRDPVAVELVDLIRSMSSNGAHHSPKLDRLTSILKQHFRHAKADTRVMIFTSHRESVKDIVQALREVPAGADNACKIKVAEFVGQGDTGATGKKRAPGVISRGTKGQTQKEQKQTLDDFRAGTLNTLVATSIGEEGLDIPSVDLIFFFDVVDIIRAIQRMGRTGRARDGKVVVLATEGKEYAKFTSEQKKYETLMTCLRVPEANFELYKKSPRMVPDGVTPVCQLAMIEPSPAEKKTKSKTSELTEAAKPKKPKKPKKAMGAKALLNAANKLKDTPLDAASKAILFAYEYPGSAVKHLDMSASTPFLSRPHPVYAIEHSDLSRAFIGVMADLQDMPRVDATGNALLRGPCAENRAKQASAPHAVEPEPQRDDSIVPTVVEEMPIDFEEFPVDDDFQYDWGNDWPVVSQDGPEYEAPIKTSQEVLEEFTQLSDAVPRRISMHSASPARRPLHSTPHESSAYGCNELEDTKRDDDEDEDDDETLGDKLFTKKQQRLARELRLSSSSDKVEEKRKSQDRLSMPPPPPRLTPQSSAKSSDATPSSGGSELKFKRHMRKTNARVLMSQEISPIVDDGSREAQKDRGEDDDDIEYIGEELASHSRRQQRIRVQPTFNSRKRRNCFVDDEADASEDEADGDADGYLSSGDERFIAHSPGEDHGANHPGARFAEATPDEAPWRRATRDSPAGVDLAQTFAALGPRERRAVQDTPSPTQRFGGSGETRSSSKYDSSFIDDGSDAGLDDSVQRLPRRRDVEIDPELVPRVERSAEDMWDEFEDDAIGDWDDDEWDADNVQPVVEANVNDDGWGVASQQNQNAGASDDDW
jgi:Fanconi anemia group M protein